MLKKPMIYEGVEVPEISKRIRFTRKAIITRRLKTTTKGKFVLMPGDIVLMEDRPMRDEFEFSHLAIKVGQFVTSHLQPSGSDMVHAILWTQDNPNSLEPEMTEASGKGYVRDGHLRYGTYHVWRCRDANWADWAAQVGMVWASGKSLPYGYSKSINCIFHKKKIAGKGRERAIKYIEDAFNEKPTSMSGGSFCSQFVIACYQAAAGQIILAKTGEGATLSDVVKKGFKQSVFLRTDAIHCSVRGLHEKLKTDKKFFIKMGIIHVGEKNKKYDQQVWRSELNLQRSRGMKIKEGKIKAFKKPENIEYGSTEWMQWVLDGKVEKK